MSLLREDARDDSSREDSDTVHSSDANRGMENQRDDVQGAALPRCLLALRGKRPQRECLLRLVTMIWRASLTREDGYAASHTRRSNQRPGLM